MTYSDQDAGTVVASNSSTRLAMEQDDVPLTPISSAMCAKSLREAPVLPSAKVYIVCSRKT